MNAIYCALCLPVLGPLLWNIAYDSVLRLPAEENCHVVCYADDTLLLSASDRLSDAIVKANTQIDRTIRHIRQLGLTVAEGKTKAMLFCRKRLIPKTMPMVRVGCEDVQVRVSMKYLGVILDSCWSFKIHFKYIGMKISKTNRALSRLMPNFRSPGEAKDNYTQQ